MECIETASRMLLTAIIEFYLLYHQKIHMDPMDLIYFFSLYKKSV